MLINKTHSTGVIVNEEMLMRKAQCLAQSECSLPFILITSPLWTVFENDSAKTVPLRIHIVKDR
jgi:hypothetical protein